VRERASEGYCIFEHSSIVVVPSIVNLCASPNGLVSRESHRMLLVSSNVAGLIERC